jgi:glycosyltransferase involved in cell wall biosynthesis
VGGVRRFFPAELRNRLDVVPVYEPDDLPRLLAACSIGVFPSYAEAFGLGVVEMLAAALPVFAYDVPGPADILGGEFLVPPGDVAELSRRAGDLLADTDRLARERLRARERARAFDWDEIAVRTKRFYERARND